MATLDEMMDTPIEEEDPDIDLLPPKRYQITSYGADFDVRGLVRRIDEEEIEIPDFQRGFVWTKKQASRFIESLLMGLPVPGIFLSRKVNERMIIVDGQQRLRSLQYFYQGYFGNEKKPFALIDVHPDFQGLTYADLADDDRRRLDNSIILTTIIKQDVPAEDEDSSIFHLFERINSGNSPLLPQEIRASIYNGTFNDLLGTLNTNLAWRALFGSPHRRMKDQELILRFFALLNNIDTYTKPMKQFLNIYMGKHRHLDSHQQESVFLIFSETVRIIHDYIGLDAFKPKRAVRVALADAIMVGVAQRIQQGEINNHEQFREKYDGLLADEEFERATSAATTDVETTNLRITLATKAFSEIG